jgi:hypothetical protein
MARDIGLVTRIGPHAADGDACVCRFPARRMDAINYLTSTAVAGRARSFSPAQRGARSSIRFQIVFFSNRPVEHHQGGWGSIARGSVRAQVPRVSKERVIADSHDRIYRPKVGEGSVIKREPRKYDLMAIRTTRVIHVPRATFMWLLETSGEFSRYIIDHLNERTGQFIAMMEVSRITEPSGRVAGAICNLFNPVLYPKAGPLLNISQEELGELAGLSRITTNLALTKLKKLQLLDTEYGGLLVLDLDRLRGYFHASGVYVPPRNSHS